MKTRISLKISVWISVCNNHIHFFTKYIIQDFGRRRWSIRWTENLLLLEMTVTSITYMKNCNIWEGRQNNFLQAFDQQCKEIFFFILSKFFCEVQKSLQASFLLSVFLEKFLCNFSRNSYMNFCMLPEFKCKLFSLIDIWLKRQGQFYKSHRIMH